MAPHELAQALSAAFVGGFWIGSVSGMAGLYVAAVIVRWWRARA